MRVREGQQVDPDKPYPDSTYLMLNFAYGMAIPIGLLLLWIGFKGKILWMKVWSVGLIVIGVTLLIFGDQLL